MPGAPRELITTDSHVSTPLSLADELPERYREKVPHLETRPDGVFLVRPMPGVRAADGATDQGDMMTRALATGIKVDPDDRAALARLAYGNVADEANPGFTVESRLAEMARDGVVGEVLIGAGGFGSLSDPEVDVIWARLMNDWLADTYRDHMDKFAVGINLPLSDIAGSVKELERGAALGMRPGLLPDVVPGRPYSRPEWEPLWEAAAGLGIPLIFHLTGGRNPFAGGSVEHAEFQASDPISGFAFISAAVAETVSWFVNTGVLERYSDLQIVMTESHAGWLGWLMEFSDHYYHSRYSGPSGILRMLGGDAQRARIAAPPSYYIKRQVKCTFMYDPAAIKLRELTGVDCLMWGNDYPHIEGIYPDSRALIDKQFAGVPEADVRAIVHDNAAALYGLSV